MEQLDELREFIDELHIRIDYADYLTLIDYIDEIYDEFNNVKQELDHLKADTEWNKLELRKSDEEVLVTNGRWFMVDKWVNSAGEVFFDVIGDDVVCEDVLWWTPLPEPPNNSCDF
jgi:hypothetical protein